MTTVIPGLTGNLFDRKSYRNRIAVTVHHGDGMLSGLRREPHLMNESRLPEIGIVQMPIKRGVGVPMDRLEHGARLGAVELTGQRQDAAGFGIEKLQLRRVPGSGLDLVFGMPGFIVPFHAGRQPEGPVLVIRADGAFRGLSRELNGLISLINQFDKDIKKPVNKQ